MAEDRNNHKISAPGVRPPSRGLSIAEASSYLGISRGSLYKLVGAGDLPARKVGSRTIILRDDLDRFLEGLPLLGGEAA